MRRLTVGRLLGLAALMAALVLVLPACRLTTNDPIRAVSTDDLELAQRCVARGVDVNERLRYGFEHENEGETPLTAAAQHAGPEMVRLLLERGADVNRGWGDRPTGTPPLAWAAIRGHNEIVRILIEAGAHVDTRDTEGQSALAYAVVNSHFETAGLLLDQGAVPGFAEFKSTVDFATSDVREGAVRWLLEHGLDPAATDDAGRGLAAYAEAAQADDVLELLGAVLVDPR